MYELCDFCRACICNKPFGFPSHLYSFMCPHFLWWHTYIHNHTSCNHCVFCLYRHTVRDPSPPTLLPLPTHPPPTYWHCSVICHIIQRGKAHSAWWTGIQCQLSQSNHIPTIPPGTLAERLSILWPGIRMCLYRALCVRASFIKHSSTSATFYEAPQF